MIRVNRGTAPPQLTIEETKGITSIEAIFNAGKVPISDDFGVGYKCAAEPLFRAQFYKCVYCEKLIEKSYQDVEHFRPKTRADRSPGSSLTGGYWWLAWWWGNLFFACPHCNRSAKGESFPLEVGSPVLPAKAQPPGQEVNLLIDPSYEDPLDHIEFRPWLGDRWRPKGKTPRGTKTIEVLQLARPELLDHYKSHVEMAVRPQARTLKVLSQQGATPALDKEIKRVSKILLSARSPFAALSFDALLYFLEQNPLIALQRPPIP